MFVWFTKPTPTLQLHTWYVPTILTMPLMLSKIIRPICLYFFEKRKCQLAIFCRRNKWHAFNREYDRHWVICSYGHFALEIKSFIMAAIFPHIMTKKKITYFISKIQWGKIFLAIFQPQHIFQSLSSLYKSLSLHCEKKILRKSVLFCSFRNTAAVCNNMNFGLCIVGKIRKKGKQHCTPPNFRVCARRKVPAKCCKIWHILYIRKPKVAFSVFLFTSWMPWSMST